jgi:hypothetical protein
MPGPIGPAGIPGHDGRPGPQGNVIELKAVIRAVKFSFNRGSRTKRRTWVRIEV